MTHLIRNLVEHPEDNKKIDFYLGGILFPLRKPYLDVCDVERVEFAIPEEAVWSLIKDILAASQKQQEFSKIFSNT